MSSSVLQPQSSIRKRSRPHGVIESAASGNDAYSAGLGASMPLGLGEEANTTTSLIDATEEPPTRRARRDVLSTQLETLQASLDHERSLRALDEKRFQQTRQRLERRVEFALEEAQEAKAQMEEADREHKEYVQQLTGENTRMQQQLQKQMQLVIRLEQEAYKRVGDADTAGNNYLSGRVGGSDSQSEVKTLQKQLDAAHDENKALNDTLRRLQAELKTHLEPLPGGGGTRLGTNNDENKGPAQSPAPSAILQELNKTRIQLSEAERKIRQAQRQEKDMQAQAKELFQQQEKNKSASKRLQQLERSLQERNASIAMVQAELDTWQEFGSNLGSLLVKLSNSNLAPPRFTNNPKVPPEVPVVKRYLQEATKEAQMAQHKAVQLGSDLDNATEKIHQLEATLLDAKHAQKVRDEERQDVEKRLHLAETEIKAMKGQEGIWKRELDSLRSIVKTFDELPLPGTSQSSASSSAPPQIRMLQARCDASAEEIAVLKAAQEALKKELDAVISEKGALQKTHNTVLEKFDKLKEALYTERAKAEKANAKAVEAEELAGKGSFNPETTRVLHMQRNPLTEALKQEVSVLKKQIAALLASSGESKKMSPAAVPGTDVDPNKLHQRLKESFKEQIGRFREGVYLLTGYKIDMIPEGDFPKFKVRSMFAEREQDHLMFQWPKVSPVESLDLLDTELAKILTTTPSYEYVKRFHSLPAFLASTQLSLFEKQTIM